MNASIRLGKLIDNCLHLTWKIDYKNVRSRLGKLIDEFKHWYRKVDYCMLALGGKIDRIY